VSSLSGAFTVNDFIRKWRAVELEEAIAGASGYPELVEEVRSVRGRHTARPQLELFGDLSRQKRVRTLDAVRGSLRAADRALLDAEARGRAAFEAFLARLRAFRGHRQLVGRRSRRAGCRRSYAAAATSVISAHIAKARARTLRYSAAVT
jgi:hypothetical protein